MLSFAWDDYLEECHDRGKALWVATLSDGRAVYQDDGRPGAPGTAWARLGRYLREHPPLFIHSLRVQFRSESLSCLPWDAPGYYWSRGVGATVGGPATDFFAVGWLDDETLRVAQVAVPTLELLLWDARPAADYRDDPRLIRCPHAPAPPR